MTLSCDYDGGGDCDWWWTWGRQDPTPLTTKRSRKCCSCGERIAVGGPAVRIDRHRCADGDIEERIYGSDDVPMSAWYLCETCSDLALSIDELGLCFDLGNGQSLREQIAEYNAGAADARGTK